MTKVHSDKWGPRCAGTLGPAQNRSISAEHDDDVTTIGGMLVCSHDLNVLRWR